WRVAFRQPLGGESLAWWLEKGEGRTGRLVVLEFWGEYEDWLPRLSHLVVRPAVPPRGAVEVEIRVNGPIVRDVPCALALFPAPPVSWGPAFDDHRRLPPEWAALAWPPELGGEGLWANWDDPSTVLDLVLPTLGERKRRLLACAVARRLPLPAYQSSWNLAA